MAHDTALAERQPVREPVARDVTRPKPQPGHKSRAGWMVPTGVAAVAAWAVGWASGATWAWGELAPRHRNGNHGRR
jgi:hypothetical protein